MFTLNKQVFIALLSLSAALATKCVSLDNEPCMIRPTLIRLTIAELNHYLSIISVDKCSERCNSVNELSTKNMCSK